MKNSVLESYADLINFKDSSYLTYNWNGRHMLYTLLLYDTWWL